MKLSFNWLCEFVDLSDFDPFEVGLRLTMSTCEMEGVQEVGSDLDGVVVGKIVEVKPHPDSDHLYLTKVDIGKEVLDIVSGAPNTRKDSFVPVALVGAKLPEGMKVRQTRIRGVLSCGVVCSEKELGVSDDHSGLWILNNELHKGDKLSLGTPVSKLFPTRDFIFEIDNKSITHRPDLWGHYGFARELSSIYRRELNPVYTQKEYDEVLNIEGKKTINIEIKDRDLCPRYTALMITNISVIRSPYMIRRRLYTLGVRPINNIVDATNYVMLEIGQPLHAFDAEQIENQSIIVRRAKHGERVTTLDGVERLLTEETLLITDPVKPVAVAGVMGGLNSEISDLTDTIILEAANFNPVNIRRTAVRLGLRTEASNRFEKSLDPELTLQGIVGSFSVIKTSLPDAKILSPLVDCDFSDKKRPVISLNLKWVSKMLGVKVPGEKVINILHSLQFGVSEEDDQSIKVEVPSFRATKDFSTPYDLVEEVGRIYGYEKIPAILPSIKSTPPLKDDLLVLIRKMRNILSGDLCFTEVYTYSFQEDAVLDLFYSEKSFLRLQNPVSISLSRMRISLIPGLFSLIEKNITYREEFSLFEVGSVYIPVDDMDVKSISVNSNEQEKNQGKGKGKLPDERKMASALMVKKVGERPVFFDIKGRVEVLLKKLNLEEAEFAPFEDLKVFSEGMRVDVLGDMDVLHPGRRALIVCNNICFGVLAELNPELLQYVGIDFNRYRAAVFEIDLSILNNLVLETREKKKFRRLPRFPEVLLAIAVVVDETVPVKEVHDFIESFKHPLINRVELFDIYRGSPLPSGKKNLAFNIFYRHKERTLTEKEVLEIHEQIAHSIKEHGWDLR